MPSFNCSLGSKYENFNYCKILFQSTIISEIIYEKDPRECLRSNDFKYLKHGIKSMCVSKTNTSEELDTTFEVKYMICDCSTASKKRLIVGFRGTKSMNDVLTDLKVYSKINNCNGRFHNGFNKRSEQIPIKYFVKKIVEDGYEIIFTGHSMGAAVAALVTVRVLLEKSMVEENCKKVTFIGFGSPLVACGDFQTFINSRFKSNFHFYINNKDLVPRLLSYMTRIIYEDKKELQTSEAKNSYTEAFHLILSLLTNPLKQNNDTVRDSLSKIFEIVKWASQLMTTAIVPRLVPFGTLIHLYLRTDTTHNENSIPTLECIDEIEYDMIIKSIVDLDVASLMKSYQDHSIKNYFHKLKPFFEKHIGEEYLTSTEEMRTVDEMKNFFIPNRESWVKNKKTKLKDLSIEPCSYHTEVIIKDSYCDVFLTISCNNIEYIATCWLKNIRGTREKQIDENTLCFRFAFPKTDLIKNGKLKKEEISLDAKFMSHFNVETFKIKINNNETRIGLSYREEKISNIPVDLLYIIAAFYNQIISKFDRNQLDDELKKQCEDLKRLFKEVDEIWGINGKPNEQLKIDDFLRSSFLGYFLGESIDEKTNNQNSDLFFEYIDSNIKEPPPQTYISLLNCVSRSNNSKDLFQNFVSTAVQLRNLQSNKIIIRSVSKFETTWIAGSMLVAPLAFVPGVNIFVTFASGLALASMYAKSFNEIYNEFRLSRIKNEKYQTNLEILMKAFEIDIEKCLPYLYYKEKEIYNKCCNLGLLSKTVEDIKNDWKIIFSNSFYLLNINEDDKIPLIRILKSATINYQIRTILRNNFFYGVVGKSNSGKSTFLQQILGVNANATPTEPTSEVKPFKIVDMLIILHYPHFESENKNTRFDHKLQFLFSRFLLDYTFLICDAITLDGSDTNNFLKLVRSTCDYRFTVLINKVDTFRKFNLDNRVEYATKEKLENLMKEVCDKIDSTPNDERVLLTCLNDGSLTLNEIEALKEIKIEINSKEIKAIYTSTSLMEKVFEKIKNELPEERKVEKVALLERMHECQEKIQKKKLISIKKFGKKSEVLYHIIQNIEPCKNSDHVDVKNYNDLIEAVKKEFDLTDPIINTEISGESVESFDQILRNDAHRFVASEKC